MGLKQLYLVISLLFDQFKLVAPRIDRKNLGRRTIRSGQMLKFDADVTGEPAPVVTWEYVDKKITNSRITIENEPNLTTFLLKKGERSDTGIYKITAKNDSGTDVAELDLIVIGELTLRDGSLIIHGLFISILAI